MLVFRTRSISTLKGGGTGFASMGLIEEDRQLSICSMAMARMFYFREG